MSDHHPDHPEAAMIRDPQQDGLSTPHPVQPAPRSSRPGTTPASTGLDPAANAELERLRDQLALTKARAEVMRDPGWLDEITPAEQDADRQAASQIRAMRREQNLAAAIADGKLTTRSRRVENRLARIELADRLWGVRAVARRKRLLDPTSRLASLQRTHVASSAALIAVASAGIVWTSVGVHDALVGPDGTPLAYVVEPIFSVPLLVIMAIAAQAAHWNRTFPPPAQRGHVYALEVFLLVATIAMNTVSVLPVVGSWHDFATLLAHLVPPMLIVVAVILQPLVAGFLAEILTVTNTDLTSTPTPVRLTPETVLTLELVARVRTAIGRGELTEWADTRLPSISAIQRYLRCEKRRAQLVWDALRVTRSRDHSGCGSRATPRHDDWFPADRSGQ